MPSTVWLSESVCGILESSECSVELCTSWVNLRNAVGISQNDSWVVKLKKRKINKIFVNLDKINNQGRAFLRVGLEGKQRGVWAYKHLIIGTFWLVNMSVLELICIFGAKSNAKEYLFLIQIKNAYGSITDENRRIFIERRKKGTCCTKNNFFSLKCN